MKKNLSIGLVFNVLLVTIVAMLLIEQFEIYKTVVFLELPTSSELIEFQPVIYEAGFFDFLKELNWKEIITLLFAGGLMTIIAAIRKAIKEMRDVKEKFILYWRDKKFTPEEKEDLIAELGEAILAIDSVCGVISGLFKSSKKKKITL